MKRSTFIKKVENNQKLYDEIMDKSYAMDESDANSRELWITFWKDGKVSASLTQRGNDYPPEAYKSIKEVVVLPRKLVYNDYDIQAALDNGVDENDLEEDAIEAYKGNYDLEDYLKNVDFDEENEYPEERKRSREESPAYDKRCGYDRHWVKSHRRNGVEVKGHCARNPK